MSAIAPVLLRYHGGEVYALPAADRHVWSVAGVEVYALPAADRHVWSVAGVEVYALPAADRHVWSVAGVEVHVDLVASHAETGEVTGAETPNTLATAAEHRRRLKRDAARRAPAKRASKTKAQSAPRRGR